MGSDAAAVDAFRAAYGAEPAVVASAPGRVNVVGGHTDHQEGFVLPVAVDRRTAVAARARPSLDGEAGRYGDGDGVAGVGAGGRPVQAYAAAFDESATFDLDALAPGDPRWADYVRGVCGELDAGGHLPPLELAVAGDVPIGAGLSSSASLELAVAGAVDAVTGRERDREALATACWRAETGFVGLSCGIMDQFAAAFGDATGALFLDCRTREREIIPFDPSVARLVVVETGVSHDLAGDAGYNERVADCRRAIGALDGRLDRPVATLRDVTADELAANADALDSTALARARHVVEENDRVREAAAALRAGDYDRLGDLVVASHAGYRDDFEVSVSEADLLVDAAADHPDAFGARLTGGGFGGSVLVLASAPAADVVRDDLVATYRAGTGIDPDAYACVPAEGLQVRRVREGDASGDDGE